MATIAWVVLLAGWAAFLFPYLFLAPRNQKRPSIVVAAPSLAGLLLEAAAAGIAFACRLPAPPGDARLIASMALAMLGGWLPFGAVRHLGRQFRIQAGLYEDHKLVRTGPYAVVRHPIYAAFFAIMAATLLLVTRWPWWLVSAALFVAGTEIRIRAEDKLLASRFGEVFEEYRRGVRAYVPWVR